jgi:hypothetical protein
MNLPDFILSLIGKTEKEAKDIANENGFLVRISSKDGEYYVLTRDYKLDRINLTLKNLIVTSATIG